MFEDDDHLATPTEACREWARNVGEDFPDRQWLLTDYDTWERNPHYHGPAQEHPYDAEVRQDYEMERKEFNDSVVREVLDADLPF